MVATMRGFLSELPDFSLQIGKPESTDSFSLSAMESLVKYLGNPQNKFESIHIAGSNGKGSTLTFCSAALEAQGYRVGTYTSPHSGDVFAGMRINGQQISEVAAAPFLKLLREAVEKIPVLSLFEIQTALAFLYFAEEQVDIAVIETGLGGRLDATNVITPLVSIITSIDLEHQAILGPELADIAEHKAGIIKPEIPVVVAALEEQARNVILKEAAIKQAEVWELGRDFSVERIDFDRTGQRLRIALENQETELSIAALGSYQIENAALAFAALQWVREAGLPIDESAIGAGFAQAQWPGRFEVISAEGTLILDAAHTPAASRQLRNSLDDFFPDQQVVAMLGVSSDKQLENLLAPLQSRFETLVLTSSSHPRALTPQLISERILKPTYPVHLAENLGAAWKQAKVLAGDRMPILVFGSVFLVEEMRNLILTES